MTVGTKSILFGAHAFWLHPIIVAIGWFKLHGFKTVRCPHSGVITCLLDPFLWLVFIFHDIGYIGKPNMDGPEGELHPQLGAKIISNLLKLIGFPNYKSWYNFTYYHSRFLAKRDQVQPSIFCAADKMAIAIEPSWIYIPRAKLSGELELYMKVKPRETKGYNKSSLQWHTECKSYCKEWALKHKNGEVDFMTRED